MATMVILDISATPETRDAALETLRAALNDTRAFEGCEGLDLIVNQDNKANIVVYERWRSGEDYANYRAWRAASGFSEKFRAMFPDPPIVRKFDIEQIYA